MNKLFEKGRFVLAVLAMFFCCVGSVTAGTFTGTFTKITSTDDLTTGYYIIAASEDAMYSYYAMGTTVSSGHINGVQITITDSTTITNPDSTIVFLITKNNGNYTFKNIKLAQNVYQALSSNEKLEYRDIRANIACAGYRTDSPKGFRFNLNQGSANIFKYNGTVGKYYFSNYSSSSYSVDGYTPVRLFKLECSHLDAPTLDGAVTVTENSATISWNEVTNATSYEVKILQAGEHVSTETVNSSSYTVNGLSASTGYTYSVMAVGDGSIYCNENNSLLEGAFTTASGSTTGVESTESGERACKMLKDGQLLIRCDEKTYNAQGQRAE